MHAFARRASRPYDGASLAPAGAGTTDRLPYPHHLRAAPPGAAHAIQVKLAIAEPGDQYEQGADRVAEQVMRVPQPHLRRACACGGGCPRCRTETTDTEHAWPQTKSVGTAGAGLAASPPIVREVLGASGNPLDPMTRGYMESRFRRDFAGVRVHSDERAGESARALNARAYTVGRDIVFAPGQYAPATSAGRWLLAHELVHVVQQETSPLLSAVAQRQVYDMQMQQVDDMDMAAEREYANSGAPKAQTCGRPSWCPAGFCSPYTDK